MNIGTNTTEDIKRLLEHHQTQGFSGLVCIDHHGEILHQQALLQAGMPMQTLDFGTAFGLASAGKLLTALAIFKLIGQGHLALKDAINNYLPERLNSPSEVTVWHLLTHTSGIEEFFDESISDGYGELWRRHPVYAFRRPQDYLPLLQPLAFSKAQLGVYEYKNSAYILLGLIVEEISGQSFVDYVEKNILADAGMTQSGYFESDQLPAHAVHGFVPGCVRTSWRTNVFSIPPRGGGEGGAYCSPRDLARLWNAIVQGDILGPLTAQFLSPQIQDGCDGEWHYAYGFWINRVGDTARYVSVGEDPGCSVRYSFYPQDGIGIGIFCNVGSRAGPMSVDLQKTIYPLVHRKAGEPATLLTCSTALCEGAHPEVTQTQAVTA